MDRLRTYATLSERLARLDDEELDRLLAGASGGRDGVCGRVAQIQVCGVPVFAKRIPLTDIERRPENVRSTANLFGIPLSCHYGLGGPGFGAWRELAANRIATDWALSGACPSFPLLYHSRIVASTPSEAPVADAGFWTRSSAVRARVEALRGASAEVVLFFEYVAQNLLEWLSGRLAGGPEAATAAVAFVDAHLAPTIAFMNARGLTHFDAHFENILTDGRRLYFGDFGLALASDFALTGDETEFLARHRTYDYGRAAVAYVHAISAAYFGKDRWEEGFRAYSRSSEPDVPPVVADVLRRESQRALGFLEFSRRLRADGDDERYPSDL